MSAPSGFDATRAARFAFTGSVEIVAHRGYSAAAPENTLAAIEAAIGAGATAVEFDLRASAEGTPILFHDATLQRTTDGRGPVRNTPMEQLRTLDAGSWFGSAFAGERIPTFAEALAGIADRLQRIYVEIKDVGGLENVDRIVEVARASASFDRVVFIAMDWRLLERARLAEPTSAVGYIVRRSQELEDAIERARDDPAAMLDFDKKVVLEEPSSARRAASHGIPMAAWTVDDTDDAARLVSLGVTRLTTNQVEVLTAWRSTLEPPPAPVA